MDNGETIKPKVQAGVPEHCPAFSLDGKYEKELTITAQESPRVLTVE